MFLCRLKSYVLNGKGIGLKVVFLSMLIVGIMIAFGLYGLFDIAFQNPSIQSSINKLPIIKIENGKIIEPIYDREVLTIPSTNRDITVVLDTIKDDVPSIDRNETIYITATKIYFRQENKIDMLEFSENFSKIITHEVFRSYVQKGIVLASGILSLFLFAFSLIGFILLFFTLCLLGPVFNKNLTASAWGRLSTIPWLLMFVFYVLSIYKWNLHISYLFLIPLLVSLLIGVRLRNAAKEVCLEKENRNVFLNAAKSIPFMTDDTVIQKGSMQKTKSKEAVLKITPIKETNQVRIKKSKSKSKSIKKLTLTAKKTVKMTSKTKEK